MLGWGAARELKQGEEGREAGFAFESCRDVTLLPGIPALSMKPGFEKGRGRGMPAA